MSEQANISGAADGWGCRMSDLVHKQRGRIVAWRKCRECGTPFDSRVGDIETKCEECRG